MSMLEIDDDAPPPLQQNAEQLQALQSDPTKRNDGLAVATVTVVADVPRKAATGMIKRGFFDAKPAKKVSAARQQRPAADIPLIKARKDCVAGGLSIPDFLRVEPDEAQKQADLYKQKLVDALKPSQDMLAKVTADPVLAAGFDDPETMAAVEEIAANPANISKYKNNVKVQRFYASMGRVMGEKLESMADRSS